MICTCRTSDDPARGLSHFLIDRDEHPVATRPIEKLALNRHSTAQVFFDGVRVPAANMIGREGDALKNTLVLFERARLHVAAGSVGIARRALDESVRYVHLRKQHGKPIAAHQLIAAKLADMAIWVDAARLLIHRAAQMLDAGLRADMEAAMAKAFATEAAVDISRQAVQIHGGNGVTRGYIVERLARGASAADSRWHDGNPATDHRPRTDGHLGILTWGPRVSDRLRPRAVRRAGDVCSLSQLLLGRGISPNE